MVRQAERFQLKQRIIYRRCCINPKRNMDQQMTWMNQHGSSLRIVFWYVYTLESCLSKMLMCNANYLFRKKRREFRTNKKAFQCYWDEKFLYLRIKRATTGLPKWCLSKHSRLRLVVSGKGMCSPGKFVRRLPWHVFIGVNKQARSPGVERGRNL